MKKILKCKKCDKYTIKEICECGEKTISIKPPKYSPKDKYGKYRRKAKENVETK
ncbi:RNA-protein complex protein Nop10 [Candidatus Woesearchaeota archaeon]|nr:RNA-protein complex protein Nop10 [Candidatus Woesearchaeota archaeon]MBW2978580.1 RNA-protein complex protein Nop10 [Candidatus Woesearchaeota archaeon]